MTPGLERCEVYTPWISRNWLGVTEKAEGVYK